MSKLSDKLASIYTDKSKQSVLQLLESLIKCVKEYEDEPIFYSHRLRITNSVSSEVLVTIISKKDIPLTAEDILDYFDVNGGFPVSCTGIDNNDRNIYGAYTESNGLTLVGVYGQEVFEQSFDVDNIQDFIKEVN